MSKKGKATVNDVMMHPFSRSILLMSVEAGN
jgi:hypothetical protein